MTGKELIEWIVKNHAEDLAIEVAYRDEGGTYFGTDKEVDPIVVRAGFNEMHVGYEDYDRVIL